MHEPRLKSGLWIQAQLRLCDQALLTCVLVKRGDADAGQVLLKVNRFSSGCEVLVRRYTDDGDRAWTVVADGGEEPCDAYIARELNIDEDAWVLEIEDPKGTYLPDGQKPLKE